MGIVFKFSTVRNVKNPRHVVYLCNNGLVCVFGWSSHVSSFLKGQQYLESLFEDVVM